MKRRRSSRASDREPSLSLGVIGAPSRIRGLSGYVTRNGCQLVRLSAATNQSDVDPSELSAVVVGSNAASGGALAQLRKSYPDLPVVVCGPSNGSRGSQRSVIYLQRLPAPADFLALLRECRKRSEDSRRATKLSRRLRETSKRLQILSEIVSTANSILEPDRVISVIMSQIQTLIPSDAWSILLVEPETGDLTFTRAVGGKGG